MKWRGILWGAVAVAILLYTQCHFVAPPLRKPDAVITLKTTGYCACMECCGWTFNWMGLPVASSGKFKIVGQTASGTMARPGTVAVDPDVFPMGTKFYIPGYGWGVARDTGGDIKGRHIDLFFWRHGSAQNWGVQSKEVKVWYKD